MQSTTTEGGVGGRLLLLKEGWETVMQGGVGGGCISNTTD